MAVVFQENTLFNMSIRENIRLGKEGATDKEVEEAARKAEIHRYIMGLPQKYDTLGRRARRHAVWRPAPARRDCARDRAQSVDLLLDQATSALDQTTEAAINKTLHETRQGADHAVFDPSADSVVDMDEIIVISGGRAIERGSHLQLLAANGMYRQLWDDQSLKLHPAAGEEDDDEDEDD